MSDATIIRCPECGANNRVPADKLKSGLSPVCGRCKAKLPIGQKPIVVTDTTFFANVEKSPLPVVVDMWAPWCGPCRTIAPMIDELASEMSGRMRFAKLNVDENKRTASRFRIESIPALLIFKNGREIDRVVGVQPRAELSRRLARALHA